MNRPEWLKKIHERNDCLGIDYYPETFHEDVQSLLAYVDELLEALEKTTGPVNVPVKPPRWRKNRQLLDRQEPPEMK